MKAGFCPQCKSTPTVRIKHFGTFPRCESCLEKNRLGRLQRVRDKRKVGGLFDGHHDANGNRYPDRFAPREVKCFYCPIVFILVKKAAHTRPICENCIKRRYELKRENGLERAKVQYWKNPEAVRRRRLTLTLSRMGLSIEWYDAQPKRCGICGTENPGQKGWCLDHDHRCCPYVRNRGGCYKCVRGLLCNNCNRGLGYFKDEPKRLIAAVDWVQKPLRLLPE